MDNKNDEAAAPSTALAHKDWGSNSSAAQAGFQMCAYCDEPTKGICLALIGGGCLTLYRVSVPTEQASEVVLQSAPPHQLSLEHAVDIPLSDSPTHLQSPAGYSAGCGHEAAAPTEAAGSMAAASRSKSGTVARLASAIRTDFEQLTSCVSAPTHVLDSAESAHTARQSVRGGMPLLPTGSVQVKTLKKIKTGRPRLISSAQHAKTPRVPRPQDSVEIGQPKSAFALFKRAGNGGSAVAEGSAPGR